MAKSPKWSECSLEYVYGIALWMSRNNAFNGRCSRCSFVSFSRRTIFTYQKRKAEDKYCYQSDTQDSTATLVQFGFCIESLIRATVSILPNQNKDQSWD